MIQVAYAKLSKGQVKVVAVQITIIQDKIYVQILKQHLQKHFDDRENANFHNVAIYQNMFKALKRLVQSRLEIRPNP